MFGRFGLDFDRNRIPNAVVRRIRRIDNSHKHVEVPQTSFVYRTVRLSVLVLRRRPGRKPYRLGIDITVQHIRRGGSRTAERRNKGLSEMRRLVALARFGRELTGSRIYRALSVIVAVYVALEIDRVV